jgi:hypothetical protein
VVEDLKRGLSEEIKSLKIKAEEVKRIIKDRSVEDRGLSATHRI